MKLQLFATVTAVAGILAAGTASAATLDDVKKGGQLQCGVSDGLAGFSSQNADGEWEGLDVDFCRAVAAAIFGDADAVVFKPLNAKERFTALQSGEVDLLSRNTTWTSTRDVNLGLNFIGTTYYDGQGFMVRRDLGVNNVNELDGASVCLQAGSTHELTLSEINAARGIDIELVTFDTSSQARQTYESGRCDAFSHDSSALAAEKTALANATEHKILAELISKEPLGPLVRHGDDEWEDLNRWVYFILLSAEEKGITSENVDTIRAQTEDPETQRMLSTRDDACEALGMDKNCFYNAIKQVGNYEEIFERNVGENTPLGLERGLNALWTEGGLLYSPPFR